MKRQKTDYQKVFFKKRASLGLGLPNSLELILGPRLSLTLKSQKGSLKTIKEYCH